MSNQLTTRQERFVAAYLKLGNATKAAIEAGYTEQSARGRGYALLNHNERVKAAVDEAREAIQRQGIDDAQAMIETLEKDIAFARETKNATAIMRGRDLQSRILGFLDQSRGPGRHDAPFQIIIGGVSSNPTLPKDVTEARPAGTIGLVDLLESGASVDRSKGTDSKKNEFSIFD